MKCYRNIVHFEFNKIISLPCIPSISSIYYTFIVPLQAKLKSCRVWYFSGEKPSGFLRLIIKVFSGVFINTCHLEVAFLTGENIHLSKNTKLLGKNTNWTVICFIPCNLFIKQCLTYRIVVSECPLRL